MNSLLSISVPFILASQSPRRRTLLEQLGVEFRVKVSPADETLKDTVAPKSAVETLARRKVRPIAERHPEALVLAADTLVAHKGEILSKPDTPQQAQEMLRRLSGTTHRVHTGIALRQEKSAREETTVASTRVTFAPLTDAEIEAYVETGAPMDKAGGYGIQDHTGPLFVEHLEGDYYTVVGLPLRPLYQLLRTHFGDLMTT